MIDLKEISLEDLASEVKRRNLIDTSTDDLIKELIKRKEELDNDALSTDPVSTKINIEALLDDEPIISPPVEVEVGNVKREICFRKITRQQMERREAAAEGYIVKANERVGLPYEHINSPLTQERLAAEKELRLLHCAMVDPKSYGKHGSAFDLGFLRENLTAPQQTALYDKWIIWHTQEADDPLDITEDDISDMVEAAKKNDVSYWINVGYTKLISFAHILALKQPDTYQTDKSLDI